MTRAQALLEISDDRDSSRRVVALESSPAVVGRIGSADVELSSGFVSRKHAELTCDAIGRWHARDLDSRNGTLLNGRPLKYAALLDSGDVLRIGEYSLCYRHGEPAVEVQVTRLDEAGLAGEEEDLGPVRSLGELEAPRIAAGQLETITALAAELLHEERPEARLQTLCRILVERLFVSGRAAILSLEGDEAGDVGVLAGPVSKDHQTPRRYSRTLLRAVREKQSPVMAVSRQARASIDSQHLDLSFIGDEDLAAMACPLRRRNRLFDVLYLSVPAAFASSEWLALVSLATEQFRLAESVWTSRRAEEEKAVLERELEQAKAIQRMWVPNDFAVDGLEVSFNFEASKWVGGDYLDAVLLSDGRYLLTVMDVCGKGMQAALVTNGLSTIVRVLAGQDLGLRKLVGVLNEHLISTLPEASFVSMVMVALDPTTGLFESINCGHPPLVVVSPSRAARELPSGRHLPLGQFPIDLEIHRDVLRASELLIGYSDGVTETFDGEGQMLGMEGLLRVLEKASSSVEASAEANRAQAIGQMIHGELFARRAGAPLTDDVSYFVARAS